MNLKICPICNEKFDIDKEYFYHVGNRYIHKNCIDKYKKKHPNRDIGELNTPNPNKPKEKKTARPKNIKICRWCGQDIDINTDEYVTLYDGKRYAHKSCHEEAVKGDDIYVDKIYDYLKTDVGIKYDYVQCEKQRKRYLKDGYTNKGIYNSLKYFYGVKKASPDKSGNRIGIVGYIYTEANEYFANLEKEKRNITKTMRKQLEKTPENITVNKPRIIKDRGFIDLTTLREDISDR